MHRHALTDEQWAKIQPLLAGKRRGPKALRGDRHFIDAVLYRTRTGLPWRDLPSRFGPWKTIYNRFANWAKRGVWGHVFTVVQLEVEPSASELMPEFAALERAAVLDGAWLPLARSGTACRAPTEETAAGISSPQSGQT